MTRAIIVGGGMGGLTAALALLQQGIDVEVCEQAPVLREVGAGLTLSSGALRGLHSLGLLDAVRAVSQPSRSMPFVHYRTGGLLWGAFTPDRPAPSDENPFLARHVFRADLQAVLAAHLVERSRDALRLGRALVGVEQDGHGVTARFADGSSTTGNVLIGADGIHSVVRTVGWGAVQPAFTGQVAWRFLVDGDLAAPHLGAGQAAVFFGPDQVFNRYLLRKGTLLNCVAIVRTPGWHGEGWSTPGDPAELARLFQGWHPDVQALIALARPERLAKWALGARPPLATWRDGRVALLGDAAHPMLPFLGLGAAMAIEDAIVLGRAFGVATNPLAALAIYEGTRLARTTEVGVASKAQGEALQAKDPEHYRGDDAPVANRALFDHDPSTVPLRTADVFAEADA